MSVKVHIVILLIVLTASYFNFILVFDHGDYQYYLVHDALRSSCALSISYLIVIQWGRAADVWGMYTYNCLFKAAYLCAYLYFYINSTLTYPELLSEHVLIHHSA